MQKLSTRQITDLAGWRAVRPAGFIRSLKAIIDEIQRAPNLLLETAETASCVGRLRDAIDRPRFRLPWPGPRAKR